MTTFNLQTMLVNAGERMRTDLAERMTSHPGELGIGREEIIRRFLRSYLPSRFETSTGFVFDCHGNVSKQLDIIIANTLVAPRFETAGGTRFYPCEAVVGAGRVKSTITSTAELASSLENLESVKVLDRSANGNAFSSEYQEPINNRDSHLHQIFTFLFICGKALKDTTAQEHVMERVLQIPEAHLWTNIILALDQYLITFACDDGVCPNPMHARGVARERADENDELLMRFYLFLGQAIAVTRVGNLPHFQYLNAAKTWKADIYYAATDDPPPYLSQIIR